jgi:biopolymer transport protein ExbB/TolQ
MGTTMGWYTEGGPVMLPILVVGIAGLIVIAERLYVVVYRARHKGRAFIERVIQLVRGGKVDEAIKACASSNAALPDMGLLILRSRSRDESDLQNVADAAALHVLPKLTRRLDYLRTLSTVAILLGAFGTVHGMHDAFLNAPSPGDRNVQLWVALAHSLTPTMFGLALAVVLTLTRAYLISQAEFITEEVREFSARLINALIDRPDVRLGHR